MFGLGKWGSEVRGSTGIRTGPLTVTGSRTPDCEFTLNGTKLDTREGDTDGSDHPTDEV